MGNKKRLKICRKQRERLAVLCVDQSREIAELETKIKARDVECFHWFSEAKEQRELAESLLQELEDLKVAHTDLASRHSVLSSFSSEWWPKAVELEPLPVLPWWKALWP